MEAIWIKAQKVLIQAISRPFCGRLSLVFRMTVAAGIQAVKIIEKITELIEEEYQLRINKENFNYSRFVSHMHYLLKRGKCKELLSTDNRKLYHILKEDQPLTYVCTEKVSKYFVNETGIQLTDEEKLYLMLHINRLCTREDCNQ